jgi:Predicted esterase of the alpha/beta hydrolase fold
MSNAVFIIPGFNDSGPTHWQSWLEVRLPKVGRLRGVDWARPDLTHWVDQAQLQVQALGEPVWLVAHSFGCLVAATLAAIAPELVAGVVFVAPAEPRRFAVSGGLRNTRFDQTPNEIPSLVDIVPHALPASVHSVVLASENDPWLSFPNAEAMAEGWGSHFVNLGEAGHVNTDSGYGPWPALLQQLERTIQEGSQALRKWTRQALERGDSAEFGLGPAKVWSHEDAQGLPRFAF